MTKIITVHGTFAGDDADEGDKWWQKGSPFLTELQDYIEEPLDVEPFHWSGANSEVDRRKAGNKLWKNVKAEPEQAIVIGHSHGGSVGIHAMAMAFLKQPKKAADLFRGFVSVGTPMILFKGNRNPFTRFDIYGRLLLLYVLSLLVWIFFDQGITFENAANIPQTIGILISDFRSWISGSIILFLILVSVRSVRRRGVFARNQLRQLFKSKYIPVSHKRDEAINGLIKGKTLSPKIFNYRNTVVGIFSLLSFGAVSLDVLSDVLYLNTSDDHYFESEGGAPDQSKPLTYLSSAPDVYFGLPGPNNSRRAYDFFGGKTFKTNNMLKAVPISDFWNTPEISAELAKPENSWIREIQQSLPIDGGYIFFEESQEFLLRSAMTENIRSLFEIGKENYAAAAACIPYAPSPCPEDELVISQNPTGTPDHRAFFELMALEFIVPAQDSQNGAEVLIQRLPASIITFVPKAQLSGRLTDQSVLRGSKFLAGKWADTLTNSACDLTGDPDLSAEFDPCTLLHPSNDSYLRSVLYRFGEIKGNLLNTALDWPIILSLVDQAPFLDPLINSIFFQIFLVIILTGIVSILVSFIINPMLSSTTTGTLRKTAFGNDGFGERVADVKASLDFTDNRVGTLPQEVEEDMIANSLHDAPMAIQRLRMMLSGEGLGSGGIDPISVAMKFEKSELIHNAYFHSPAFIKYLAALMIEKFGLTASSKFKKDEQALAFQYLLSSGTEARSQLN